MSRIEKRRHDVQHTQPASHALMRSYYQHVLALTMTSQPNLEHIAEVLAEHAAFRQVVLRTVNSSRTGLLHPIESLRHAVSLLGASGVAALAESELQRLTRPWEIPANTPHSRSA